MSRRGRFSTMAESTRPNFFVLLGLNPRDRWDPAHFAEVLKQKRQEWSRQTSSVGRAVLDAARNIALIPQIEAVMNDDAQRGIEAQAAIAETDHTRKEALEQFDDVLRIAQSKGYIKDSEITAWAKEFQTVLTEAEIRRRVSVPIQSAEAPKPKGEQLNPTIARNIHDRLEILGLSTLYALLNLPQATDARQLREAASALNQQMQNNSNKTPEVTVKAELAGFAMDVFKSGESKHLYDETLRLAELDTLLKKYEIVFRGAGEINATQSAQFLQEARAAGWSVDEASDRLKELAKQRKWAISIGGADVIAQQQMCGYCRALNDPQAHFCVKCACELRLACPKCKEPTATDAAACSKCGFPVGNRYLVDSLLEECVRLLAARNFTEASALIGRAAEAWRSAQPADARTQQIQARRAEVDAAHQAQQRTGQRLRRLMDERRYFEAREVFATLAPDTVPDQEIMRRTVSNGIAQAQQTLQRALGATIAPDDAADICQQALRQCADYKEARDLLAKNPPAPPAQLVARVGGSVVNLNWQRSSTRGTSAYRIVRKRGTQPVSSGDGQTIATVVGTSCDDTTPEVGVPLFYAVFADREGVPSTQGAMITQPIMLTADVRDTVARVDNGLIELTWQPPANVRQVAVTRKEGLPPRDLHDGVALTVLDHSHLTDRGLRNETRYYYRIVCQFLDQKETLVNSAGIIVDATPQIPPQVVSLLSVEMTRSGANERVAVLRWKAPAKGSVAIVKATQPPALRAGSVIPEANLRQYGQILQGQQETLSDIWQHAGACYYLPVVLFQHMAYAGPAQHFAAVDDVAGLHIQNQGAVVRLHWVWPDGCRKAQVATSLSGWPPANDPAANVRMVDRTLYDRLGYFEIPGQANQDLFIVVYAVMALNGEDVLAPGTTSGARAHLRIGSKVVLEYEIKRSKSSPLFGKDQVTLQLRPRTPARLPAMILKRKQYSLPFNKTDGDFVQRVEAFAEAVDRADIPLEIGAYPPESYAKLFLEDDGAYDVVEVNHPSRDKLRIA